MTLKLIDWAPRLRRVVVNLAKVRKGREMLDIVATHYPEMVASVRRELALKDQVEIEYAINNEVRVSDDGKMAWTLTDAAKMIGIHAATLRRAVEAGELKAMRLSRHYRVSRAELEAWWQSKGGGQLFSTDAAVLPASPLKAKRRPPAPDITDAQIEALRAEAGQAGDLSQVSMCDRALEGSSRARRECAYVIAAAAAMGDD
jgi:excisionase family DNA binding protein